MKGFAIFARKTKVSFFASHVFFCFSLLFWQIKLIFHTTSRQMSRDFVKAEFEKFCSLLSKYGVDFEHQSYFEKEHPTMEMHFRVLEHF